jgi:uncharacterized protein (TIGR03000 family)
MLKRCFPVVGSAALALILMSAGTGRAQLIRAMPPSPLSGLNLLPYAPYGMGYGSYSPGLYGAGYGMPSSIALAPITYVAFYPPVYTTRAPVVAPPWPLLPTDQVASVTVIAPPDAVVTFDGQQTSQIGTHRFFTTPPLEKGQSYHYMVEVSFTQDGKSVHQTQRVQVHSGGEAVVVFPVAR